jgi:hypothetical protein
VLLPVDVPSGEAGQLGHPQAGVEQGPDDKAFVVRGAGVGEDGSLVLGERFALVLIGHAESEKQRVCQAPKGSPDGTGDGRRPATAWFRRRVYGSGSAKGGRRF